MSYGFLDEVMRSMPESVSGSRLQRLAGWWVMVNAFGGFEGLVASGVIKKTAAYQTRKEFLEVFGVDAEKWQAGISQQFRPDATLF